MLMPKTVVVVEEYEQLGKFFEHFNVHERIGITFERFCQLNDNGLWQTHYAEVFAL